MSTRKLAELESKMEEWISENCERDDWMSGLVHPHLGRQMASAAYSVFSAADDSQNYADSQRD